MPEETNSAPSTGDLPLEQQGEQFLNQTLEEQVSALRQSLQEAREEAGQNLDSAQRAHAELANFRRRSDEERIAQGKYSNGRLIAKLLPVMEEFELAVSHAGAEAADSNNASAAWDTWLEGVKLIQRKLMGLLESEGVTPIESVGAAFNPLEHEALGTEESADHPPGYVTQALRQGYRLYDRIIQPAQVIVAREPEGADNGGARSGSEENGNG